MQETLIRLAPAALWLTVLWLTESLLATPHRGRVRHGFTNLALAGINGLILFFTFGATSVWICQISPVQPPASLAILHWLACFVALDLFSYLWHRLNHAVPVLWRLHSVHHSDANMDVTTAGRFHVAELGAGGILRLPVLYFLGVPTTALLAYETVLVLVSMFHHSAISLGRFDRRLRWFTASPLMHSIHHSRDPVDFNTNFSSVFSIWDRLFRTLRITDRPDSHGLDGINADSLASMYKLPFVRDRSDEDSSKPTLWS